MDAAGSRPVPLLDVKRQYEPLRSELLAAVNKVCDGGRYVLGPECEELERDIAKYTGARHAIACASGSDALLLALMALDIGPGHEVICPSYTFSPRPAPFGDWARSRCSATSSRRRSTSTRRKLSRWFRRRRRRLFRFTCSGNARRWMKSAAWPPSIRWPLSKMLARRLALRTAGAAQEHSATWAASAFIRRRISAAWGTADC